MERKEGRTSYAHPLPDEWLPSFELYAESARFRKAVRCVPPCEVVKARGILLLSDLPRDHDLLNNERRLRVEIAYLRWVHPICSGCLRRDAPLYPCERCLLVRYCSALCRKAHLKRHRRWCCRGEDADCQKDDPHRLHPVCSGKVVRFDDEIEADIITLAVRYFDSLKGGVVAAAKGDLHGPSVLSDGSDVRSAKSVRNKDEQSLCRRSD